MALPVASHVDGDPGHTADHNTLAVAVNEALTGQPFVSAGAYTSQAEQLIYDPQSTANWFGTNVTFTNDTSQHTLGTSSLRVNNALFTWDGAPKRDTRAYVNLTPVSRGTRSELAFDFRWVYSSFNWNHHPNEHFEFVAADGADLTGNVVTARMPLMNGGGSFTTCYISIRDLSTIQSFGFRYISSKRPATDIQISSGIPAYNFWFDNVRLAAQTQIDRALEDSPGVVVPGDYTPSITPHTMVLPDSRSVIDFRTQGYIANDGGVRHVRQFQTVPEGTGADARTALNDIFASLSPGDTLVFPPGKQYRATGTVNPVVLQGLRNVTIDARGSTIYSIELKTDPIVSMNDCIGVTVKNLNVNGGNPRTVLGSALFEVGGTATVSGTTRLLDAQGDAVSTNPTASGGYWSRDKDGKTDVDFVLSDSAQVANDCIIEGVDANGPTTAPTLSATDTTGPVAIGTRYYRVSYVNADGYESWCGPAASITTTTPSSINMTNVPIDSSSLQPKVVQRNIYRTKAGAADEPPAYHRIAEIYDNTTTTWRDRVSETTTTIPAKPTLVNLGAGNVDTGTHYWAITFFNSTTGLETCATLLSGRASLALASPSQVQLTIAVGPAGTTERRIYRQKENTTSRPGTCFLVGTVADNVTTTFTDNVADASLGTEVAPEIWNQGRQPQITPRYTIPALTTTPTTYRLTTPGPDILDRRAAFMVRKATATTNTITVHSHFSDRLNSGGGGNTEFGHAFRIFDYNSDILLENVRVDGALGDGISCTGTAGYDRGRVTLRNCFVNNVGRQGAIFEGSADYVAEGCEFHQSGHWGIDIEPETWGIFMPRVLISDCDFYNGGSARGAIVSQIGDERAARIVIRRVRCFGRTGDINVGCMYVQAEDIEAPWYRVSTHGRQIVVGRVRCAEFDAPQRERGAWTTFTENTLATGSVIYGPIILTEDADPVTALGIDDPTIPIGPVIWQNRVQPQVHQVPMLLKAGVPTDADFPYTPLDGAMAINQSTDDLYYRKAGTWTLMT